MHMVLICNTVKHPLYSHANCHTHAWVSNNCFLSESANYVLLISQSINNVYVKGDIDEAVCIYL